MDAYRVVITDYLWGSVAFPSEVGYYSNYDKALKALEKRIKTWKREIREISAEPTPEGVYEGEWIDPETKYIGGAKIIKIKIE